MRRATINDKDRPTNAWSRSGVYWPLQTPLIALTDGGPSNLPKQCAVCSLPALLDPTSVVGPVLLFRDADFITPSVRLRVPSFFSPFLPEQRAAANAGRPLGTYDTALPPQVQ